MKEKENLTAERSLEIIRESIESSQRTITKNSSYSRIYGKTMVDQCGMYYGLLCG